MVSSCPPGQVFPSDSTAKTLRLSSSAEINFSTTESASTWCELHQDLQVLHLDTAAGHRAPGSSPGHSLGTQSSQEASCMDPAWLLSCWAALPETAVTAPYVPGSSCSHTTWHRAKSEGADSIPQLHIRASRSPRSKTPLNSSLKKKHFFSSYSLVERFY